MSETLSWIAKATALQTRSEEFCPEVIEKILTGAMVARSSECRTVKQTCKYRFLSYEPIQTLLVRRAATLVAAPLSRGLAWGLGTPPASRL